MNSRFKYKQQFQIFLNNFGVTDYYKLILNKKINGQFLIISLFPIVFFSIVFNDFLLYYYLSGIITRVDIKDGMYKIKIAIFIKQIFFADLF
jgi:hypothetical protein